jgi:signal transduction histidine kinase
MGIDFKTIGIISTLIGVLHAGMLFLYRKMGPGFPGVSNWIAGLVLYAVAFLFFAMRETWPSVFGTVVLPNGLVLVSQCMLLFGVCRFQDRPYPILTVSFLLIAATGLFLPFVYLHPDITIRLMVMAAFTMTFHGLIAWALLSGDGLRRHFSHKIAGGIFVFLGINDLVRLVRAFFLPWSGASMFDPVVMGTVLVTAILVTPLTTYAFALLIGKQHVINGRLLERELQEARVRSAEQEVLVQKQALLRDLHDGLSGSIAAIYLNSRFLNGQTRGNVASEREDALVAIEQLAAMSSQEIRTIMHRMEHHSVTWAELEKEWRQFAFALLEPAGIEVVWNKGILPHEPVTDMAAAASLSRMLKEAIHNILRHSGAVKACIDFTFLAHQLKIEVVDFGCGLSSTTATGRGFQHLHSRATELGGSVDFTSNSGLRVCFILPLPIHLIAK